MVILILLAGIAGGGTAVSLALLLFDPGWLASLAIYSAAGSVAVLLATLVAVWLAERRANGEHGPRAEAAQGARMVTQDQ